MSQAAHGGGVRMAAYALRAVLFAVAAVVAYLLLSAFDRPAHADPGLPSPVAAIPSPNLPDAAPALPHLPASNPAPVTVPAKPVTVPAKPVTVPAKPVTIP